MSIDNSKLVLELFNFRKGLSVEDDENIDRQVSYHMDLFKCDETGKIKSQMDVVSSLTERLNDYTYDSKVKELLENVSGVVAENELFYELEDLYRRLENSNQGQVYSHPMQVILDIINEGNDRDQQVKIINELALYDWIPDVKKFMWKYSTDPRERQNLTSEGGKADLVYSVVEKVQTEKDAGFLTFIGDKWFFLSESDIEPNTPSYYINDRETLSRLNLLEKALRITNIENDTIIFNIEEDLDLGISLGNGKLSLNGEEMDGGSTLESIFNSPLIPMLRKDLYPVISETIKNLDKFVNLDIVQKISNITNPFLEAFAFNYKEKMYTYSIDKRYGNHFHQYDSASLLCNEMSSNLGFDLSQFFEDKFSEEVNAKRELEDREKFIVTKLSELNENIKKLEACGLVEINEEVKIACDSLKDEMKEKEAELQNVKGALSEGKYMID